MLFNSLQFLIFLPTVLALYLLAPLRLRNGLLVIASCLFYMALIPQYILILFLLIGVDYAAGLLLEKTSGPAKKAVLVLSLLSNLGLLGFFKYWNFAVGATGADLPLQHWVLPIGLSFHTFQSMAYTIEVYRGNFKAERNLITYSLYVLFFPQMVAGPIERPGGLLTQLQAGAQLLPERTVRGLRLILLGFAKKIMIADRLAPFVKETYARALISPDHSPDLLGPRLWLATFFFAFQIYGDFSGYTDIARGVANLLGYELCLNFRRPYAALSLGEFWRRWHISLSSWFRDFVYIPLGGSRAGRARAVLNLFLTFLVSGFWHGANWTFLMWGGLHGLGVCLENLWGRRLPAVVGWLQTWLWVLMAWVFFRAANLATACFILWGGIQGWGSGAFSSEVVLGERPGETLFNLALCLAFLGYQILAERIVRKSSETMLAERPAAVRHGLYFLLAMATLLMGQFSSNDFIYFQF